MIKTVLLHHLYVVCCHTQVDISQCWILLRHWVWKKWDGQEADLLHVLRPVEARKLIAQVNAKCKCISLLLKELVITVIKTWYCHYSMWNVLRMVRNVEHVTRPDSQPLLFIQGEKDGTERNSPTPRRVSGSPQTPRSEDCSFAIRKYIRKC